MALQITENNFETEVIQSKVPVLVDFWATWCGPCRMMTPVIEQLADEAEGRYKICSVNVDDEPELAARYDISMIPTMAVIKSGEVAHKFIGVHGKDELLAQLL